MMNVHKSSFINHKSKKPVQYQQGWAEFYKLRFNLTPDVLIPRPETELLVDGVLNFLKNNHELITTNPLTILDLGTGSGNIAVSIAKNLSSLLSQNTDHLPTCQVGIQIIATDISEKTLKIAKQNAKLHGVENQIIFLKSNLLSAIPTSSTFASHPWGVNQAQIIFQDIDIVVTNLPYIPTPRIPFLDSSVLDFEPIIALDGGKDGFELYRKLFAQIKEKRLNPKLIIGEIDYTHKKIATYEASKYFPQYKVEVKTDLAHKQRILSITA